MNNYLPTTAAELVKVLALIPHPEGGYFRETFRSGSEPMSSRGQTDLDVTDDDCLVTVSQGRVEKSSRADQSRLRNCLTSIYWVPTTESPIQPLIANLSDHVHYYQGGLPFEYHIYNPKLSGSAGAGSLRTIILGPDILNGHQLQFPLKSGEWKCGRLLVPKEETDSESSSPFPDYCIVSEAVGPGFDFHDFHFVTLDELNATQPSEPAAALLRPFLHEATSKMVTDTNVEFDKHYD